MAMHLLAADHPAIVIPAVLAEYSSGELLVTNWVTGEPWRSAIAADHFSASGACQGFVPLLRRGPADPWANAGGLASRQRAGSTNRRTSTLGVVRFWEHVPAELGTKADFARLIVATRDRCESPYPLFLKLGFDPDLLAL